MPTFKVTNVSTNGAEFETVEADDAADAEQQVQSMIDVDVQEICPDCDEDIEACTCGDDEDEDDEEDEDGDEEDDEE